MINLLRRVLSVRQEKELENLRASAENTKVELEKQKLLTRYVAEMNDIYIPEDEENGNEGDSVGIEG